MQGLIPIMHTDATKEEDSFGKINDDNESEQTHTGEHQPSVANNQFYAASICRTCLYLVISNIQMINLLT